MVRIRVRIMSQHTYHRIRLTISLGLGCYVPPPLWPHSGKRHGVEMMCGDPLSRAPQASSALGLGSEFGVFKIYELKLKSWG